MFARNLDSQSIKIGELLVLSGALDSGDVVEAVTVSRRLAMPVGRVLIVSGCITEELLEAALQAQVLAWEGSISIELAEAALKLVVSDRIPLYQALGELHWHANFGTDTASLIDLLLESEIVSRDQLEVAICIDSPDVVPLTSALVVHGLLSPKFFPMLSQIQQKIHSNGLSRADAANELRAAYRLWLRAEQSVQDDKDSESAGAHDRVFRHSGLASNWVSDLSNEGLQIVCQPQTDLMLDNGSELDEIADAEVVGRVETVDQSSSPVEFTDVVSADVESTDVESTDVESVDLIDRSIKLEESQPDAIEQDVRHSANKPDTKRRLIDLLAASKIVDMIRVQEAFDQAMEDPQLSGEILVAMGLINERTCNAALRYHDLLAEQLVSQTEAVHALQELASLDGDHVTKTPRESRRRTGLKRVLTAAVVGSIAAAAVFARKR